MKNNIYKIYLQPAFLICTVLLAAATIGMSLAIERFQVYLKKEPIPLKKPLDDLAENDLRPYEIAATRQIENKEVIKTLGTEDYIQWLLADSDVPADNPVGRCLLFITYYKLPDIVPHVPDECYIGGGYQKLTSEPVTLHINSNGFNKIIPAQYVLFGNTDPEKWLTSREFPVLYFFRVNGVYVNGRQQARKTLNKNLFYKHSYFSKVELSFGQSLAAPTKQQALAASEKLLAVLLPVLEEKHWPDWKKK